VYARKKCWSPVVKNKANRSKQLLKTKADIHTMSSNSIFVLPLTSSWSSTGIPLVQHTAAHHSVARLILFHSNSPVTVIQYWTMNICVYRQNHCTLRCCQYCIQQSKHVHKLVKLEGAQRVHISAKWILGGHVTGHAYLSEIFCGHVCSGIFSSLKRKEPGVHFRCRFSKRSKI